MKNKILLIFSLSLFQLHSYSQNKNIIDSLVIKLKMYDEKTAVSIADSFKSLILYDICEHLRSVNDKHELVYDKKAVDYAEECLSFSQRINYRKGIGYAYFKLGEINMHKDDSLASIMFEKALVIFKETRDTDKLKSCYSYLSQWFELKSDFSKALVYAKENQKLKKSNVLFGDMFDNMPVSRLEDKVGKQNAEVKVKEQKKVITYVAIGLLIILSFAVFVVLSLRIRNKQNKIIIEQKDLVEEKNKQILESIEYAKRIQATILPPPKVVKKYLEDSFILYLPKDIVAGDFYWMENPLENEHVVLFAACDCTGHGVPGALVSVVCSNALNRTVKEFNISEPAKILDKVAELVVIDFSKDENENVQDGMDTSLCALNVETGLLQWAGANNPLWIVRNRELLETKANKQPIGRYENMQPFTNHTFETQKGDTIYLITDGYADQFGGEKNKKLGKGKFKEMLISIQHLPLPEQRNYLYEFHNSYRGANEQVDDILIIGVKV